MRHLYRGIERKATGSVMLSEHPIEHEEYPKKNWLISSEVSDIGLDCLLNSDSFIESVLNEDADRQCDMSMLLAN